MIIQIFKGHNHLFFIVQLCKNILIPQFVYFTYKAMSDNSTQCHNVPVRWLHPDLDVTIVPFMVLFGY